MLSQLGYFLADISRSNVVTSSGLEGRVGLQRGGGGGRKESGVEVQEEEDWGVGVVPWFFSCRCFICFNWGF